jgi:hypothetical protein
MKNLLTSLLLLTSISIFAQGNSNPKTYKQDKGGCNVTFHNTSVSAILQNNSSQPQIQVSWNNNRSISGSSCICLVGQILARQAGNNNYDTLSIGFVDTSYIDTSILPGIAYNYRLWRRETCSTNEFTIYSDTITVQTVGINEEMVAISKIYPIPATTSLFLETNQLALGEPFRVMNMTGNTVIEGIISSDKVQVNIEALPKGFYFIQIKESFKKIVVN